METDPVSVKRCEKAQRTLWMPPSPFLAHSRKYRDTIFGKLVEAVEKLPVKEQPENRRGRSGTWSLVDRRKEMRKAGPPTQRESRSLARAIKASLKLNG